MFNARRWFRQRTVSRVHKFPNGFQLPPEQEIESRAADGDGADWRDQ
jgi:hypothetical protein